jgi:crossover junction endodeoxyribonuclease RuvC
MASEYLFIGIDPGSRETGYFVLSRCCYGCFKAVNGGTIAFDGSLRDRLFEVYVFFMQLFGSVYDLGYAKVIVCIENPYVGKNIKSSFVLVSIRSVIMILSKKFSFEYEELAPSKIRKVLCGRGDADKDMVCAFLNATLRGVCFTSLHESDAAATAFASATSFPNFC